MDRIACFGQVSKADWPFFVCCLFFCHLSFRNYYFCKLLISEKYEQARWTSSHTATVALGKLPFTDIQLFTCLVCSSDPHESGFVSTIIRKNHHFKVIKYFALWLAVFCFYWKMLVSFNCFHYLWCAQFFTDNWCSAILHLFSFVLTTLTIWFFIFCK